MSATAIPYRLAIRSIPSIGSDPEAVQELRNGILEAITGIRKPDLEALFDYAEAHETDEQDSTDIAQPYLRAFARDVTGAAADEILPHVVAMLDAAIAKRLPWTWEPER